MIGRFGWQLVCQVRHSLAAADVVALVSGYGLDYPGTAGRTFQKPHTRPRISTSGRRRTSTRSIDIRQATLVGISIGATISLVLAARGNPRVTRAIAVNPYDYWSAGGIRKSSLAARLVLTPSGVPLLGATIMRLRNRYVSDRIFEGGLASPEALPKELAEEFYEVGARLGHYQGFLSLLAHERLWPKARNEYASIKVPVNVRRFVTSAAETGPGIHMRCLRPSLRSLVATRFATMPPCLIGIEAEARFCSSMASRIGRRPQKGSARAHSFRVS